VSAFAQSNCQECLELWNALTYETWSCASKDNPSGGMYGIIDNYDLARMYPTKCGDSRWCAAACATTSATTNWWN